MIISSSRYRSVHKDVLLVLNKVFYISGTDAACIDGIRKEEQDAKPLSPWSQT